MSETNIIPTQQRKQHWFVFYVMAKHERKVNELLIRDGFETYLPLQKVVKQWTHRKKTVEEPLFKSYIFVHTFASSIWEILQTPGMVKVVRFNSEPATLAQKHIDLIKEMIESKTRFEVSSEKIKIGDLVLLKTGPFKGFEGIIKEIRGSKKLLLYIESMGLSLVIEHN